MEFTLIFFSDANVNLLKMKIFDFLYYVIYNFYRKNGEKEPWIAARIVVGLCPLFNLISVLFIVDYLFDYRIFSSKYQSFLFSIPMVLFSYYRYSRITSYEKIANSISMFSFRKRKILETVGYVYMIISFLLFIGLAFYIGRTS